MTEPKRPVGRPMKPETREVFELFRQFWKDRTKPGATGMDSYVKMKDFYDFLHVHYKCQKARKFLFKEVKHLSGAVLTLRRRYVLDEYVGDGEFGELEVRYGRPIGTL